jgi:hypothetical protein
MRLSKVEIILLISSFILLLLMLLFINPHLLYDEPAYLGNVSLLEKYGFRKQYLLEHNGSAGPLYTLVHYLFKPLTNLQVPYVRFVNIVLLLCIITITAATIKLLSYKTAHWTYALYITCMPFTFFIAGLALTEIPAMLFLCISLYCLLNAKKTIHQTNSLWQIILAAISMNLVIIGRQPYLLILPAIPFLFLKNGIKGKIYSILFIVLSLPLPIYVFSIWGGLVAPIDTDFYADIAKAGKSYSPEYVLLYLNFVFVTLLLIAPKLFTLPGKRKIVYLIILLLFLIISNYFFKFALYVPSYSVVAFFINPKYLEAIIPPCLFIFSLLFLRTFYYNAIIYKEKEIVFFLFLAVILIGVSCLKITYGFSSRYAAQALPFIAILGSYFYSHNKTNALRIILSTAISALSLLTYYKS